jgi:2-desacetyl-2-hydroxyethyl bacteriochlorophyllide A dehydrogenase
MRWTAWEWNVKAIICEKPYELNVIERAAPERQAGEVLIRIRRVGLCGTDYHIYAGNQPFLEYPRVIGHELAGEVAEVGPGSALRIGQVVTVNPYLPCGHCVACRKGKPNCCMFVSVLGVHRDGGLCETLSVPERAVHPVGDLTVDQAAMVEFLSVGAHAVRRAAVTSADRVLVVGAGPIGVGVALFAGLAGGAVTLIDVSRERLDYARDHVGVADVAVVGENTAAELSAKTDGEFFDVVFDATGNIRAMNAGLAYVAHGGRYVLVSVVKGELAFNDPDFHKRETTLLGSRNATDDDFRYVIQCMQDGLVPTAALNTHSLPLADTPRMMPELIKNQGSVLKAIVAV